MEENGKPKDVKLRFYNVVIHPSDKHNPKYYVALFDKIHQQGRTYDTGREKKTKMRSYVKSNDCISFTLINYTTLDGKDWYDEVSDKIVQHEVEPNIHPNGKEWNLFFVPEKHRLAVVVKRGISWPELSRYLNKAFGDAAEVLGYDEVKLTQETSQEGIDEIFSLDAIDSIEIEVSYSNNDTNDITAKLIDNQFKDSNISTIKTKAVGTKGKPITLNNKNDYIPSLVMLSKHNGYTKAKGKEGNKSKVVNTKNYPNVEILKKVHPQNMLQAIIGRVMSIF